MSSFTGTCVRNTKKILGVSFLALLHNFSPSMLILKNQLVGLLVVSLLADALFLMFVLWVLIDYLTITCDSAERVPRYVGTQNYTIYSLNFL